MPVVECDPKGDETYAKGRNGYFNLQRVSIMDMSDHEEQAVSVHFESTRSAWPHSAYARLTPEKAIEVGQALVEQGQATMAKRKGETE